jgi:starch synthase (maltosyl-transferring)
VNNVEFGDRVRVTIKAVYPEIEFGRFPVKRTVGEKVVVKALIFADGHDRLAARLIHRKQSESEWIETIMTARINDRWEGSFVVHEIGRYEYSIVAWVDRFESWRADIKKRAQAEQEDLGVYLLAGAQLVEEASAGAIPADKLSMQTWAKELRSWQPGDKDWLDAALSDEIAGLVAKYADRKFAAYYPRQLVVVVDREKARFSTWYELFPRSCSPQPGHHGTLKDCEDRLPYIADMGFDVVYLPPIHPIGRTNRKGKNNALIAGPSDPGTPWAIGADEGGHRSIHPELGTLEDFHHLLEAAKRQGLEIALDLAFQCSPDHPYVREHPSWFSWRPDGRVQYAENPPKKYQDIYPLNFESDDWKGLWEELEGVVLFWIEQGVRIFRVDNPHTKSFNFWEWLIHTVKARFPEVIFLAEAFTRPNVMYELAEIGFSQSYTYFAWRNTKWELSQYFEELGRSDLREFFRPNLWPNTPDILTEYLQSGGKPAFMARVVLAATLGANYGIYGPAYELGENIAREPGSEEYLDSEKYEIKSWDITNAASLKDFISRVNRIRRESPPLQQDLNLSFHPVDNDSLICYSKCADNLSDVILVVVNLDPHHTHSGWLELPLDALGIDSKQPYQVHDLLSGARYLWQGPRNYVELDPKVVPAHIFRVRRRVRTERDFDYYL